MESPKNEIKPTYVGGKTFLIMLGKNNCFVVMRTSDIRQTIFLNCLGREWLRSDTQFTLMES